MDMAKVKKRIPSAKKMNLQKAKNMNEKVRMNKLESKSKIDNEDIKMMPGPSNEDEWISCQTDINKLVQPGKTEEYILPEQTQPEATEETQKSYFEVPRVDSPDEKPLIIEENDLADNKNNILPEPKRKWLIKNQLCRCCLAEGIYDSLHSPAAGDYVTYDFILMNSFNIQIYPVSSNMVTALRGVCGLCAARLRDAHAFQRQVIASELHFRNLYTNNCITVDGAVDIEVKLETPDVNDDVATGTTSALPLLVEQNLKAEPRKRQVTKIKKERKKVQPKKNATNTAVKAEKKPTLNRRKPGPRSTHVRLLSEYFTRIGDELKCTACEKIFQSTKNLLSHYKMVHLKIKRKPCVTCECGINCLTITKLKLHKLEEHNIDERYKCGACDKIFNKRHQLKIHIQSFHMLGEKIKCPFCDYECYTQHNLQRHMVKHKTSKDYQCKYCKKAFLREGTLKYHERIHTGDKRKACAECGQAFVQKASLNYHMTKYHPEVKF